MKIDRKIQQTRRKTMKDEQMMLLLTLLRGS